MTATVLLDGNDPAGIREAARMLMEGMVVAIPTDTVYGLAASVLDEEALQRVYDIKERPSGQAMPVLLGSARDARLVAEGIPAEAWPLINRFWPGPLSLVLRARPSLSMTVRAGGDTVAVRVPAGQSVLQVLESVGVPLTGTSANLHGQPAARSPEEALAQVGGRVDAVLADASPAQLGVPSTIVSVNQNLCTVHRTGAVSLDLLRETLGTAVRVAPR